jgi:hypothetical protein
MSSDDDSDTGAGLTLMFVLGGFALLVFLPGIVVIYYISYGP